MSSTRKSKKLLTMGLATMASLSLVSVGFATWYFGVDETSKTTDGIGITVSGAENNTVMFELTCNTTSIKIDALASGDGVLTGTNFNANGLKITASASVIVADNITLSSLTYAYEFSKENQAYGAPNVASVGANDVFGRAQGSNYKYVTLNKSSFDFSEANRTAGKYTYGAYPTVAGYHIYNIADLELSLSYSDFFNNLAPETFYGNKLNALQAAYEADRNTTTRDAFLNGITAVKTELDAMKNNLTGSKLKITVTANKNS